jgi:putative nucleotidyltransferase with HDIG domain
VASVLLVMLVTFVNPNLFGRSFDTLSTQQWYDIGVWGGSLILTAAAMGALYDRNAARLRELRDTYRGVLMILRQFISKDAYTQNHSYRVSIYAARVAAEMGFDEERVEDVRAAALLHDIGKLDISREILYKAAQLNASEAQEMREHVVRGISMLEPVGGSLRRVLPIILAHHDRFDGTGTATGPEKRSRWRRAFWPWPMPMTPSPATAPTAREARLTRRGKSWYASPATNSIRM